MPIAVQIPDRHGASEGVNCIVNTSLKAAVAIAQQDTHGTRLRIGIEGLLLPQHVINGPAQPRRQDTQSLGLAVLLLFAGQEALGLVALASQQAGGFREGPLQMGVADLGPAAARHLAGRQLLRPDETGVRQNSPLLPKRLLSWIS